MGHNLEIVTETDLHVVNCSCGGVYAILESVRHQKEMEGGSWACPYCRTGWGFANNGTNARLRRELKREKKRTEWAQQDAKQQREQAEHNEYRRRAEKAAKTKIKNRIANGVCPCCNRSFKNLHQHMSNKHPDFVPVSS